MEEANDLPYRAEYSKSSRASCRMCKGKIEKGVLRLAVLIQSPSFDGKITHWYHCMCFFAKQRPKSVQDIAHFDSLRWEDQQKIKKKVEESSVSVPTGQKGEGAPKGDKNFSMEYAKSGRAVCKGCEEKIFKDTIRISKMDYEGEKAKRFGPIPMWHHVDCFVKLREELEFFQGADALPGFFTLSAEDKKILRAKIAKVEGQNKRKAEEDLPDGGEGGGGGASKKAKKEDSDSAVQEKQSKKIFHFRDRLEKALKKAEMADLLQHNGYDALKGESNMLDVLADLMTFGVIDRCAVCKDGNLVYRSGAGGYVCLGDLSEWTKCTNVVEKPGRKPFKVPAEFKEAFPFMNKYTYKSHGDRVVTKRDLPLTSQSQRNGTATPSSSAGSKGKPLQDFVFVIVGTKFQREKKSMKEKVLSLGGGITTKLDDKVAAVITTKDLILDGKPTSKLIQKAKSLEVECVEEDFLEEVEAEGGGGGGVALLVAKKNIAPWGGKIEERLSKTLKLKSYSARMKSKSSTPSQSDLPKSVKVTLKDGGHIDPSLGLADNCHVYKRDGKLLSVVLGMVDLVRGINSYYKLQVIQSDKNTESYVYRSWGRIGTKVGDSKLDETDDVMDAVRLFRETYEKKTGNKFGVGEQRKVPGMWFPLDLDDGQKVDKLSRPLVKGSRSKLPLPVQELVSLLFDVESMESTMVEYELDLKKMPLGKLSQNQLANAYKVLSECLDWLIKKEPADSKEGIAKAAADSTNSSSDSVSMKARLLDCSNRFYTLIPHDFGMKNPPLLDNVELIKTKIEMIDSLREIEVAYNLLRSKSGDSEKTVDPIDKCYGRLKTDVGVIDSESKEFHMIRDCLKNTHAATHSNYTLDIEQVFRVDRNGESRRFKPFKKLPNRQLLWHGSRLTNFAGILSQGLRIAPPEAPATGYMFGKGVYFADMASKSANYCCASRTNPTGLLLLCDVALGSMYELESAKYITKLPSGKHSTKGLGRTRPDPAKTLSLSDGLQVHVGEGTNSPEASKSSLLYNEYIVYDESQINVKYLVKTKFNYSY